jgi:hypothetical protein
MKSIIVSGKYKGEDCESKLPAEFIPSFTHGVCYMISVSQDSAGRIQVSRIKEDGDLYIATAGHITYDSIAAFLSNWDEIATYPTLELLGMDG